MKVWWDGGRKNESIARKVESLLTNLGADVDLQREILSFNSDPPYIRMRPESIGAQQIMNFLEEKLKITFEEEKPNADSIYDVTLVFHER